MTICNECYTILDEGVLERDCPNNCWDSLENENLYNEKKEFLLEKAKAEFFEFMNKKNNF